MANEKNPKLARVYSAANDAERRAAYNSWANEYDADVLSFGIRLPFVGAATFARFVSVGAAPVLDAACGTGMQTESLALAGFGPFHGIDISDGMLEVAESKNIYTSLQQMTLGKPLDFEDAVFPVTYCVGALTPGHAPASSFDELIRVTKIGGKLIFSLRVDSGDEQQKYIDALAQHVENKKITREFSSQPFVSMPGGDADILHQLFVYEVR